MSKRVQITVLCGGQSPEHEISLRSARNVANLLDVQKYEVSVVYIDHQGAWYRLPGVEAFTAMGALDLIKKGLADRVTVRMGDKAYPLQSLQDPKVCYPVDCFFPVLHGSRGEDGTVQGLFTLLDIPYVGSDVTGSSVCMDKVLTKQLLKAAGLPVVPWITVHSSDDYRSLYPEVVKKLGHFLFVKPATLGSSVGVSPARHEDEFLQAMRQAFEYDDCVLIEQGIDGHEVECAVLGGGAELSASLPGEIRLEKNAYTHYSYEAKYLDPHSAQFDIPAQLDCTVVTQLQELALAAFRGTHCFGMCRVDFFVTSAKEVFINELNTIPGFTAISLYPKMWEASGLTQTQLMDRLIELALLRHQEKSKLESRYLAVATTASVE